MARSDIDICNRALARVGADDIASLADESAEARACAREYEETLLAALTAPGGRPFRWSFATTQKALSRLTATPIARYAYAWQVEPNTLVIHAILVNSVPIEFTRLDDNVFCDADDGVIAEYTFRASESGFPSYFVEALTTELAAKLAVGLNRDTALGNALKQEAMASWAGARSADSQARTARRVRATRILTRRFG
jgi:hypothetical protein